MPCSAETHESGRTFVLPLFFFLHGPRGMQNCGTPRPGTGRTGQSHPPSGGSRQLMPHLRRAGTSPPSSHTPASPGGRRSPGPPLPGPEGAPATPTGLSGGLFGGQMPVQGRGTQIPRHCQAMRPAGPAGPAPPGRPAPPPPAGRGRTALRNRSGPGPLPPAGRRRKALGSLPVPPLPGPSRSGTAAWSGCRGPGRTAPAPAGSRPPSVRPLLPPQGGQQFPLVPVGVGDLVQRRLRPVQIPRAMQRLATV